MEGVPLVVHQSGQAYHAQGSLAHRRHAKHTGGIGGTISPVARTALRVTIPSFIYISISALYLCVYYYRPLFVNGLQACMIVLNLLFFAAYPGWKHLIISSLVAQLLAFFCGMYNFGFNAAYAFAYDDLPIYTNVVPTSSAASILDAGFVTFSSDSVVDTAKAVGYRTVDTQGHTLCVAPIMDTFGSDSRSPVYYWAVGFDCCGTIGEFHCDDVGVPGLHGGAVLLRANLLNKGPVLDKILGGLSRNKRSLFLKAIERQSAEFPDQGDLPRPDAMHLIRWVKDPQESVQGQYWTEARGFFIWSSVAVMALFGSIGTISHFKMALRDAGH